MKLPSTPPYDAMDKDSAEVVAGPKLTLCQESSPCLENELIFPFCHQALCELFGHSACRLSP